MAETKEVEIFDWDDEIENDGSGNFVIVEEGDYEFEVTKFERGHYTPSSKDAKTPPCNQAMMTLKISTPEGDCFITDKFPLASTMEWKMSSFFRSIGLKKHGERVKMKWGESIGCRGKAHVTKTEGTKKDGVYFNNIDRYIDPVAKTEEVDEWN